MSINSIEPDKRSIDQIYAAAQKESGPLIVSAGGDAQAQWDPVRTAFAKQFPKLALELTVNFSKYHDSRIDRELMEGIKPKDDIIFIQDLHVFPRWTQQGVFLRYKPPTFDDIYSSHKDVGGAWAGLTLWSFGKFLYDRNKLNEKDLPRNYLELATDPKWKGKLVLTIPNDDDAIGYLFSLAISRYGWGWLEALKQQDVQWVRGTATPAYIIAEQAGAKAGPKRPTEYKSDNGQRVLTFTTAGYPIADDNLAWKDPEYPEQYMGWTQTAGILKDTQRPETAKLFIAWIASVEFQSFLSMNGTAPTLLRSLNEKNKAAFPDNYGQYQLNGFRMYSNDRRTADWYRMQYESILGTAQGVDPMKVYDFDDVRAL